ncbi:NlpC/P60 family protein [Pediococcus inopinatus]|uniref:NlpC/P60 family protein n=1 Tax=Pediococcus inopinatus TaxID=114090 RepID=A0ABZ0Q4C1_9LACO|nr:C40 family peptidase [Pediococcus inopinatus]WPC19207.1 NlpC/P60 family protein [Pediococcus inopinatus]WPC20998.1 NlpC/P60 family protein [Pediococcus inopinatus]WPP10009.1 NlpC/P60 family protein [Pediococcus inopinatus]
MVKSIGNSTKTKIVLAGVAGAAGLFVAGATQSVNADSVKVAQNDTVWGISQKYNVSIKSIETLNKINQKSHIILVGQKVEIPGTTDHKAVKASSQEYIKVTVKSGDSLWQIAQDKGVSVASIKNANNLSSNLILVGQTLKVPVAGSTAAKASSSAATVQYSAATSATTASSSAASSVESTPSSASVSSSSKAETAVSSSTSAASDSVSSTQSSSQATTSASSTTAVSSASSSVASSSAVSSVASESSNSVSQASSSAASSTTPSGAVSSAPVQSVASTVSTSVAASSAAKPVSTASVAKPAYSAATSSTSTSNTASSALTSGSVVSLAVKLANANIPYVWGGSSLSGMDCSGLVAYVFEHAEGVSLPHYTVSLESSVTQKSVSAAQPGDLLFWGAKGATYHVAIYIGNNQYVAAPQPGQNVDIETISSYFAPSFAGTVK